jgi:DNA damage-inducible protein 1
VGDLKGMVEAEAKFPANTQSFFFNGQALRNDTQTLEDAGIKDGEMLAMMVNRRNGQQQQAQQRRTRQGVSSDPEVTTPERIEEIRTQILQNPAQLSRLLQQNPDLAAVINEPARFQELWQQMLDDRDRMQRERQNQLAMLNEDPFNPEAQKKIEDMIRREKIEANLQYAYENNPEGMTYAHPQIHTDLTSISLWPSQHVVC